MSVIFDPPRYNNPEEVIGLTLTIASIPILTWNLYRIGKVFRTKRTWFLFSFMLLVVFNLAYEILALYSTYIGTNVALTILRTDCISTTVFLLAFVIREIVCIFAVADPTVPRWMPNAVCGLLVIIFIGTVTPRYFLYILYVSVRENNFMAKWGSFAYLNPILTLVVYETVFLYTLWTLYRRRAEIRSLISECREADGTGSGKRRPSMVRRRSSVRASTGSDRPKGFSTPWFCCYQVHMHAGDAAIVNVSINVVVMMVVQSVLSFAMNNAGLVARPGPSYGWRMSQQYFVIGGFCNSMMCVLIWDVVQSLKKLLLSERMTGAAIVSTMATGTQSAAGATASTTSTATIAMTKTVASVAPLPATIKSVVQTDST
ncbi:hypothetical protein BC831DRAFT_458858 [Entophlyctis helioformis]|nr:hypothetical protein BC831DRAFT_458858 [Entophlyctis helioformis]